MQMFSQFLIFVLVFSVFFFPSILFAQSTNPWSLYNNPLAGNALDIFYTSGPNPVARFQSDGIFRARNIQDMDTPLGQYYLDPNNGSAVNTFTVKGALGIGLGATTPTSDIEIQKDNANSEITFHDPGNFWWTMGMFQAYQNFFMINAGSSLGEQPPAFSIQPGSNRVGIRSVNGSYGLYVPWISGDTAAAGYFGSGSASNNQHGLIGQSNSQIGVYGVSNSLWGVYGLSSSSIGVYGASTGGPGVQGSSINHYGVYATSQTNAAVRADSNSFYAVYGVSTGNQGGVFESGTGYALTAQANGTVAGWVGNFVKTSSTTLGGGGLLRLQSAGPASDPSGWMIHATSGNGSDAEFLVRGDGSYWADGTFQGPGDYAEQLESDDTTIGKGEVVCVDKKGQAKVVRCSTANSQNIVGVISTLPGVLGTYADDVTDAGLAREYDPRWKKVGILGQVPTRVSTENGVIEPGDYLTSSSTPGLAMKATKAGMVIGKALERYDGTQGDRINVMINPIWHGGSSNEKQQAEIDQLKKELEELKNKIGSN